MNEKKEIVKIIQKLSGQWSPYQVFTDWVECTALAIQNTCYVYNPNKLYHKREQQYCSIMKKYSSEEQHCLVEMSGLLSIAMGQEISDILGEIYMESGCGNKNTGQFFTPFTLSKMCASLILMQKDLKEDEIIPVNEPSCGAGGMIIAMASVMKDMGINYQQKMRVTAQDLDWKAVYMTYVQLSLYGIDAVVVQGNTLAEPFDMHYPPGRTFRTPKNMGVLL